MGKPFMKSRRELTEMHGRAIQYLVGGAAVTVIITWADDGAEQIDSETHISTTYGMTRSGKPIGSLPGQLPQLLALGHLNESVKSLAGQAEGIAKAQREEEPAPPAAEDEVEDLAELAGPQEEADAEAHE